MPKDSILMMKAKVVMKKASDLDVLNKVKNAEEKLVLKALNLKKKIEEKAALNVLKAQVKKEEALKKKKKRRL